MNDKQKFFEEEFLPHANAMYNFAFHYTQNERDAEDLVQDTFLKCYKFIEQSSPNSKLWLFKVLKNQIINGQRIKQRKEKKLNRIDLEEVMLNHDQEDSADIGGYVDLPKEIFRHMLGDEIIAATNRMPIRYQTVFLLLHMEDFRLNEVSTIMDIPVGTVRAVAFRARNLLKVLLKDYAQKKGYK